MQTYMDMTLTDSFLLGLLEFFEWARWLFMAAFILTMTDLRFGITAARYRKENIKKSRAVRRTFDKLTSYTLWVILAYTFGKAFGNPFGIDLLPLAMLVVIYGVELESIYVNYFAAKGRNVNVKFFKGLREKSRHIIEIEDREEKNGKTDS